MSDVSTGPTPHRDLSERELQTLHLAARGLTDQAIAIRLGISLATVGTYWGRIRTKHGPHNRTELVANYLREQSRSKLDKLQQENSRLIVQIQEEDKLLRETQDYLKFLRVVLDTATDAIVVCDEKSRICMVNEEACRLFGYTRAEFHGKHIPDLVPESFRANHIGLCQGYMAHPERKNMGNHEGTFARHRDGSDFPIAASLNSAKTRDGLLVVVVIRAVA